MALIVTYSTVFPPSDPQHTHVPLMVGRDVRTELINLDSATAGSTSGALSCASDECVVDVYAQEECWIQIGQTPVAESEGSTSRYMAATERIQYWVETGDKVAGILA